MESQIGTEPGPSFSLHPPRAREAARARSVFAFPALTVGRGGDHLWDRVSKAWKSPLAIPQFPLPPSWPQITPLMNHSVYWVSQKFCLGFSARKTKINFLANSYILSFYYYSLCRKFNFDHSLQVRKRRWAIWRRWHTLIQVYLIPELMLFPLDHDAFLDLYKFSEDQEFGHLSTPSPYNCSTPYWTVEMELGRKLYI